MLLLIETYAIAPFVLWLTIGIGILGVILLVTAATMLGHNSTWHHIARDLGLAFLIAAIVATLYELNTRSIFDLERLEGVLKTVLASNVPPNVWDQINKEILQRDVIRKNFDVRASLIDEPSLSECQKVLKMTIAYDLYGLSDNQIKYILSNELGSLQLHNPTKTLPRFESVTVGTDVYKGAELAKIVEDGKFTITDIGVGPKGAPPIHIEVVRFEVIYVPGNYDLALSELTDSIRVHIDFTGNLKGSVKIWSNKGSATLSPAGDMWFFNGVMFPGQELTIRFMK